MGLMTSDESEDSVFSKDQAESPLMDGCSSVGSDGVVLKKGPWTSSEDSILIEYVKKNGEGNWNSVQKHSGLSRCGKSCRLRWTNHLRPDLKKGAFTEEEEQKIVELHAKMGNKWARMATYLPGRTDNEIKNYWNTRIKRRQRAGLPLYPPEVSLQLQALHDSQSGQTMSGLSSPDKNHHDHMHGNSFEFPEVVFSNLNTKQDVSPYVPELPDIPNPTSTLLMKGLGSQYGSFIMPQKRLRESSTLFSSFSRNIKYEFPTFEQFHDDTSEKVPPPFDLCFPPDPDPDRMTVSQNENLSASKPVCEAVKSELPSLQYPDTSLGRWGPSPPHPPLLESVDAFIHSPLTGKGEDSDCLSSPRNSGLLDALLHESKTLRVKNNNYEKSSNSSSVTPCETEWEEYVDRLQPLGHSGNAVFSSCTPLNACASSLDEPPTYEKLNDTELTFNNHVRCNVNSELDPAWTPDRCEKGSSLDRFDVTRPDALLDSDWLKQGYGNAKDNLLDDDFCADYKQMASGNFYPMQGWGLDSCAWNNMPSVCQISEFP
ncbi:hypothetical protein ACFE04_000772 [Oxalis oulophora]